jgi:cytochrome c oxidase subunit IV
MDPFQYQKIRKYLTWTFVLILFLLMTGIAIANEYTKIRPINPDEVNGQ